MRCFTLILSLTIAAMVSACSPTNESLLAGDRDSAVASGWFCLAQLKPGTQRYSVDAKRGVLRAKPSDSAGMDRVVVWETFHPWAVIFPANHTGGLDYANIENVEFVPESSLSYDESSFPQPLRSEARDYHMRFATRDCPVHTLDGTGRLSLWGPSEGRVFPALVGLDQSMFASSERSYVRVVPFRWQFEIESLG